MSNLYLSAQLSTPQMLYDYYSSPQFATTKASDISLANVKVNEAKLNKVKYLEEQNRLMSH